MNPFYINNHDEGYPSFPTAYEAVAAALELGGEVIIVNAEYTEERWMELQRELGIPNVEFRPASLDAEDENVILTWTLPRFQAEAILRYVYGE